MAFENDQTYRQARWTYDTGTRRFRDAKGRFIVNPGNNIVPLKHKAASCRSS